MRRLLALTAILLAPVLPAYAATKVTVQELDTLLAEMHRQSRTDDQVSNKRKEMELTEELLPSVMNGFVQYQPGPQTIVQIRVLALDSALLSPPPSDLPIAPAPDRTTQAAILGRAIAYAAKTFAHLPRLDADKQTLRYQNGDEYIRTNVGVGAQMGDSNLGFKPPDPYLRFLGQSTTPIVTESGVELPPAKTKRIDPASQNGQITQGGAGPILGVILVDAAKGKIAWLRWETLDGKQLAVFSFVVVRDQSQYQVNYCCFPKTQNVGSMFLRNYATNTTFEPFKSTVGYHGEIFIDPATGTVLRLITQAEFKTTDLVQQEDSRIDYAATEIDGTSYVLPVRNILLTKVVVSGNSFDKFQMRRTLFDLNYSNYRHA